MDRRVLVVDDDMHVRKLFARMLARSGYEVATAESGVAALQSLRQQGEFDLMILDLCMPEVDGFDVLKEVRAAYPGLRTLVISGFMGGGLLEASGYLGATATLAKSQAAVSLVAKVDELLRG